MNHEEVGFQLRQVLEKEELLALADRIKDNYPYCLQTYNTLLLTAKGLNACFQYEIYVLENYQDSHVIIWRSLTEWKNMSIYCREEDVPLLIKVMNSSHFLNIVEEVPVLFLAKYQEDPVFHRLQEIFEKPLVKMSFFCYAYATRQESPLRCPAGMRVQRLGRAGIQKLLESNQYWKKTSGDLVHSLAENLPALGIFLDPEVEDELVIDFNAISFAEPEEVPIAHAFTSPYGYVGSLHTDVQYRKRGLGSLLVSLIGRLLMAKGWCIPYSIVYERNEDSNRMFEKLPGWKKTHCVIRILPGQ
ncbi:uncharacterized protein [Macrobrachium rosenbergii]|uniref:uncharacterized protein n=1 Tax=Macrobrachium rosenbergii TaxID=79674 RepID=UPI0034D40739